MPKERIDLREELRAYKAEFGLVQKIPCPRQENKQYQKILKDGGTLPEGVYAYDSVYGETPEAFYTVYEADLTAAEMQEYLTYKRLRMIRTIKNCAVFFTVLAIISLAGYFLLSLDAFI